MNKDHEQKSGETPMPESQEKNRSAEMLTKPSEEDSKGQKQASYAKNLLATDREERQSTADDSSENRHGAPWGNLIGIIIIVILLLGGTTYILYQGFQKEKNQPGTTHESVPIFSSTSTRKSYPPLNIQFESGQTGILTK